MNFLIKIVFHFLKTKNTKIKPTTLITFEEEIS